jgi:hypothetical protein
MPGHPSIWEANRVGGWGTTGRGSDVVRAAGDTVGILTRALGFRRPLHQGIQGYLVASTSDGHLTIEAHLIKDKEAVKRLLRSICDAEAFADEQAAR